MARTLAEVREELTETRVAYRRALKQQSYSVSTGAGSRSATRASVRQLRELVLDLEREEKQLMNGGIRVSGIVPHD